MNNFDLALLEIKKEYQIVDILKYSMLIEIDGEKKLYDQLYRSRKDYFEPNERIIFVQDCNDIYEYHDDLGNQTKIIQQAIHKIDITNCFVTIVTPNTDIANELLLASPDQEPINHVIVPGEYEPIRPTYGDTFCVMPWIHLHITPDGSVLPCCAADVKHPLGNINEDSIQNIYNNKKFQKLRQGLLNGKHPVECSYCWIHEKDNLRSHRLEHNKKHSRFYTRSDGLVDEVKPVTFDIRINKICNLKCRSCSPHLSSAIAQEVKEIYNVDFPALNNRQRQAVMSEILALLPTAEHIYFAGGEPLLAPEHLSMITELLKIKNTDLSLFYNTNFMQLDYKDVSFTEIWKHFSNVVIGASLDAHGPVAEYLRHGTVWSTIESNFQRLKNEVSHVNFRVTSTVGFLNIENLIDFQRDWTDRGLISIHQFQIAQIIYDSFFSVQVAPLHHKQRLGALINNHIKWLESMDAHALIAGWQQVFTYMWAEDRTHLLPEFQRTMLNQDYHRKESFSMMFPQFEDLISR